MSSWTQPSSSPLYHSRSFATLATIHLLPSTTYATVSDPLTTLIDSGADVNVIAQELVDYLGWPSTPVDPSRLLLTAGGDAHASYGVYDLEVAITDSNMERRVQRVRFESMKRGSAARECPVILGHPWLSANNPTMDWVEGKWYWEEAPCELCEKAIVARAQSEGCGCNNFDFHCAMTRVVEAKDAGIAFLCPNPECTKVVEKLRFNFRPDGSATGKYDVVDTRMGGDGSTNEVRETRRLRRWG
jgi:hypothetical protein